MVSKKTRKFLLALGGLVGLLLLLVLALPLWLPWLLRPVAAAYGVHYSDYARKGYSRFELTHVTFTNRSTAITAKRLEGYVPSVWLWQLYLTRDTHPYAAANGWKLQTKSSAEPAGERSEPSVYSVYHRSERTLKQLNRWLPHALLQDGSIEAKEEVVRIPRAAWDDQKFSGDVLLPKQKQQAEIFADLRSTNGSKIQLISESLPLRSRVFIEEQGNSLLVKGTNTWLTNQIVASARFTTNGIVPQTAQLESKSFSIPARLLKLEGYQSVEGALAVSWLTNQFKVEVAAHSSSAKDAQFPPVEISLSASGNTDSATVQKLNVATPWVQANLSEGTTIQYTSPFLTDQTTLRLALNLDQQGWVPLKGKLSGQLEFRPGQGAVPESTLTLSGTNIVLTDLNALVRSHGTNPAGRVKASSPIEAKTLSLQGELVWPELRLTQARAQAPDGSTLSLQGIADLSSQMIHYGQLSFHGGYLRNWLPSGFNYDDASLSATVNGQWTNLSHSGKVQVKALRLPLAPVFDLAGSWKGEQLRLDPVQLSFHTAKSSLEVNGAIDLEQEAKVLRMAALSLTQAGVQQLATRNPFEIRWTPPAAGKTRTGRIEVTSLQLSGAAGNLEVAGGVSWPDQGHFSAKAQQLHFGALADFLPWATNRAVVHQLDFSGGWTNGPLLFQMALVAEGAFAKGVGLAADLRCRGAAEGLRVEALSVRDEHQQPIATLNGSFPVRLRPGRTNGLLETDLKAPLALSAEVSPNAFANYFKTAGLLLQNPELHASLEGTLEQPKGSIQFAATRVEFTHTNTHLPALEQMRLTSVIDQKTARLDLLKFEVAKQPVALQAEVPLDDRFWAGFPRAFPLPDWKKVKGQIKVDHAQLAAFGPYLPPVLSPEGEVDGTLGLVPGGKLTGVLTVSKVRTYPIGSLGAVRDILVRVRLQDRKALLEAAAEVGGSPVPITGTVDLSGQEWLSGQLPPFVLKVVAGRAPLSRTPELILKSDLNLTIAYDGKTPVTISGNVNLRDGYYLRDLGDLTSGKISTPARRPPYFSVEQEPLAGWRLNLGVTGEKFLKVRSPLFNGEVSTALHLHGTLREPVATGELKVNSGEIRFPFATMPITQGLILLTSENPYRPQMSINAAVRTFGYDVKMDLSGFADKPVLQFSSTPALSSEQILLMVSAGELPRGELTFSTTQKAQRLALFVGKDLLSELGFSGDASRLTIRSGEDISEAGRPTYSVEYKLEQDWSVIGEYDRFNDFNLMLKWRFYSR